MEIWGGIVVIGVLAVGLLIFALVKPPKKTAERKPETAGQTQKAEGQKVSSVTQSLPKWALLLLLVWNISLSLAMAWGFQVSSSLGRIDTNLGQINANLGKIEKSLSSVSSGLSGIDSALNGRFGSIYSELGQIDSTLGSIQQALQSIRQTLPYVGMR